MENNQHEHICPECDQPFSCDDKDCVEKDLLNYYWCDYCASEDRYYD